MVTTALRQMGREQEADFSRFHQVLNRARWSALQASAQLLELIVETFVAQGPLELVIDETLERRRGPKIRQRGYYRDPLRSSRKHRVMSGAVRWMVVCVVVKVPWSSRRWALPFVAVPAPSPKVSEALGQRHKTLGELARQLLVLVRRWMPDRPFTLVGDTAYSIQALGTWCQRHQATLVTPLRPDAALYDGPPEPTGKAGARRKVGARLPTPQQIMQDPQTSWQSVSLLWYASGERTVQYVSQTALWYRAGKPPVPIRWVIVRDPTGVHPTKVLLCSDPTQSPEQIIRLFILRWSVEVTFEECRAHLGVETQRQWSDVAVERTTPVMLGLFSLATLCGHALFPDGQVPITQAAWYHKSAPTFRDVLCGLRQHLWHREIFLHSPSLVPRNLFQHPVLARLLHTACY
jgi:hypothetical protein